MSVETLRKNAMMNRLLDALHAGKDIGHYGRLVFAMVARHFLDDEQLVKLLQKDKKCDETQARSLVAQVQGRDYNPPRREKILQWQKEQDFQLLPDNDPDEGNVYRDLDFPPEVYEHIQEYYEAKAS